MAARTVGAGRSGTDALAFADSSPVALRALRGAIGKGRASPASRPCPGGGFRPATTGKDPVPAALAACAGLVAASDIPPAVGRVGWVDGPRSGRAVAGSRRAGASGEILGAAAGGGTAKAGVETITSARPSPSPSPDPSPGASLPSAVSGTGLASGTNRSASARPKNARKAQGAGSASPTATAGADGTVWPEEWPAGARNGNASKGITMTSAIARRPSAKPVTASLPPSGLIGGNSLDWNDP